MNAVAHSIIAALLHERTGQHMAESRRWRIDTALASVLRDRGLTNLDQLACLLADPRETALAREVVEALLNNETYFFRDRQLFDLLQRQVLPHLAAARAGTRRLAIWSAGCSTGQEVLSLAMLLAAEPERWAGWTIDIVATDISERAIATARQGVYSQFEIQRGLGVGQMLQWFSESPAGWRADPALSRRIRWSVRDLLAPPPNPGRFDLVLCRNVLLYFDAPVRARAFARLAQGCADDGWLMIGAGETAARHTQAFAPAGETSGLYRRAPHALPGGRSACAS